MNTVFTMAKLTFREAIRRRIVTAGVLMGIAFLFVYDIGFHYMQPEMTRPSFSRLPVEAVQAQANNLMLMAGLYVVNFLVIVIAALITSDSLAGEIQSGTIQAIVTKPVRRIGVVLGKWLGNAALLFCYVLLMSGGVMLSLFLMAGYHTPNWLAGIALIYFNSLIIMTLALALSSTLSTIATGAVVLGMFGLAFIGGWVERIGVLLNNQTTANIGILSSLLMPSDAVWNKAASQMTSPLIGLTGISPFSSSSVPSTMMMIYAILYLLAALAIGIYQFGQRDL